MGKHRRIKWSPGENQILRSLIADRPNIPASDIRTVLRSAGYMDRTEPAIKRQLLRLREPQTACVSRAKPVAARQVLVDLRRSASTSLPSCPEKAEPEADKSPSSAEIAEARLDEFLTVCGHFGNPKTADYAVLARLARLMAQTLRTGPLRERAEAVIDAVIEQ